MKILTTTLLVCSVALSGCSSSLSIRDNKATACAQGIHGLNNDLNLRNHTIHQANISRANSLLLAAQVQLQFAEYPGCIDKVQRAQKYLSGQTAAIISRL